MSRRSVGEALAWGQAQLPPQHKRDTAYLLRAAMQRDAAYLLAHGDEVISDDADTAFRNSIARRRAGEPVQYIVGKQEFWGMELLVTPDVLIPRPETEHVVEAVLARADRDAELRIVDVGTGSGAIAVALAKELPRAKILATDISDAALRIAWINAQKHRVEQRITFSQFDLLPRATGEAAFDFVVSNPPYVGEQERESLPREVREYEPAQALFAGHDGLEIYRRLIPAARGSLKPGGWLVMEMGAGQQAALQSMLLDWKSVVTLPDLQGIARVVCAQAAHRKNAAKRSPRDL